MKPANTMRAKVVFGRMGASAPIFFFAFFLQGTKFLCTKLMDKKNKYKRKKTSTKKEKKGTKKNKKGQNKRDKT
mgnify:CR=1 FL=1